ncbi:unnamed protein product [Prorocentrum cordatum]|uniref:RRM domain-containing protein n=1 Tax=Prorocentrum cordatum TaxID=2364126 RepID=A0ABN9RZW0_9DINO|nr:unnamed protein product [Polarella glacialis]
MGHGRGLPDERLDGGAARPHAARQGDDAGHPQLRHLRHQREDARGGLAMGVRFLDLRVRPDGQLCHGRVTCALTLVDALKACGAFLREHPGEVLLVRIKDEAGVEGAGAKQHFRSSRPLLIGFRESLRVSRPVKLEKSSTDFARYLHNLVTSTVDKITPTLISSDLASSDQLETLQNLTSIVELTSTLCHRCPRVFISKGMKFAKYFAGFFRRRARSRNAMSASRFSTSWGLGAACPELRRPAGSATGVKNTFISVDERFIEDVFESDDEQTAALRTKRQMTEPAVARHRQVSRDSQEAPPTASAAGRQPQESIWQPSGSETTRQLTGDDSSLDAASLWNRCVTGGSASWQDPPGQDGAETVMVPYASMEGWVAADFVPFQLPMLGYDTGAMPAQEWECGAVEAQDGVPADWGDTLTVMMRNLPNKFSQQMLLEEINLAGFAGTYDFLYLPIDPDTKANRGYAFINFVGPAQSWMFRSYFEGRRIGNFNSGKVITVMPATLQGFDANHAHYASARVSRGDPSLRPLFLRQPSRASGAGAAKQASGSGQTQRRRRGRMSLIDAAAQLPVADAGARPLGRPEEDLQSGAAEADPAAGTSHGPRLNVCFCPYCGGKAEKDFRFCKFCGKALPASS